MTKSTDKKLFYFKPEKQGDILMINWEAPTTLEKELEKGIGKKYYAEIGRETGVRTPTQNASLHLYFELLAKELNDVGCPVQLVLKERIDVEWDKNKIKELLWRPTQQAVTGKKSTVDLDKISEITEVWEHLNRFVGEKFGVHVPFPSKEQLTLNKTI